MKVKERMRIRKLVKQRRATAEWTNFVRNAYLRLVSQEVDAILRTAEVNADVRKDVRQAIIRKMA